MPDHKPSAVLHPLIKNFRPGRLLLFTKKLLFSLFIGGPIVHRAGKIYTGNEIKGILARESPGPRTLNGCNADLPGKAG